MNPEIKQRWIEALRSGDYEQTQNVLGSDQGFCCLGVLCDIEGRLKETHQEEHTNSGLKTNVMADIEDKGLNNPYPNYKWAASIGLFENNMQALAEMNDEMGYDFNRIADYIEFHL